MVKSSKILHASWSKIYCGLCGMFFLRGHIVHLGFGKPPIIHGKLICQLVRVDSSAVTYRIIRNGRTVTTRLPDFVRDFSIINYKADSNER